MLSDELEILSITVEAPRPEPRSAKSIIHDHRENRPKFLPGVNKQGGLRTFTLKQHYSTVIPRRMMQGLGDMPYWSPSNIQQLVACLQHHDLRLQALRLAKASVAGLRGQSQTNIPGQGNHRLKMSEMAGAKIRTDTVAGKYQMDRTFLQLVVDNALRELLQPDMSQKSKANIQLWPSAGRS
ncbi:hypothetical protein PoB_001167200 [Plakobranchus ocellatus]|uniref:Uncharacterized protein n=1 Tax=Plakobranchus ocellatus TaxID=259542 RepID=A0AAV3YRQ1_9GAST|nr:hypothetical protein PoB_001167200 [Plakobranchus ocellatus]